MALSLRTKIVLVSALPLLVIHLLVFGYSLAQLRQQALTDQAHWLLELARAEARQFGTDHPSAVADGPRRLDAPRGRDIHGIIVATDRDAAGHPLREATLLSRHGIWRLPALRGESGDFVAATAPLPDRRRELLLVASDATLLTGFDGQARWLSLLFALSASLILLIIWAVATRVTEPLEDLDSVVREISAGNLAVAPKASAGDEMGRLATTIGAMARRVEQRDGELRLARDNLERRVAQRTRELTREIARRQRVEAELRTAKETAQQASQAKSDFLSNMSHELRTPLNGVLGYAQILRRDTALNEQQRSNLLAIEHCGEHLLTLINDVLDLAKIEAGQMSIDNTSVDLHQLLHDVRDIVAHRARSKDLALLIDVDAALPAGIRTDGTKLRQILLNLLGNAIKFTDQGQIELSVQGRGDRLQFTVSDTGSGIAADELETIFDAFRQAGSGLHAGGTGLGLAINQHLISLMGGDPLQVDSRPGKGSHFSFSIPLQAVDDDQLPAAHTPIGEANGLRLAAGQRACVLVVDDSADSRDILRQALTDAGFAAALAADADTALQWLRQHPCDLVLMDIRMPGVSGLDAIAQLRDDPSLAALPVVAITASVLPELMRQTRAAGFDDVLGKPFRLDDLLQRIARLLDLSLVTEHAAVGSGSVTVEDWPVALAAETAERIRAAVHEGDMGALGDIADELEISRGADDPTLAQLRQLARNFDFGGLETLATDLTRRTSRRD